jgi:DNA-binding transcriptional LysR family regulator
VIFANTDCEMIDSDGESESPMELRQLRYFVAVGEDLHFRRAAQRLHMTQPPLSAQIQALEAELGCLLLQRTRRRVELTPAGASFLRDARALLAELDGAVAGARLIAEGQRGRLRATFVGSALLSLVPDVVRRFRAARPHVEVELRERSTVEQLRALSSGAADVALIRPPVEHGPELRSETITTEPMLVALPASHPLVARRRLTPAQLADEPLVLFPRAQAPGYHDLLIGAIAESGTAPSVVQYAPEMVTIVGLVAAGIGISLVPASVARLTLAGVVYRPLRGGPQAQLDAVVRADDESQLVRAFVAETRLGPDAVSESAR